MVWHNAVAGGVCALALLVAATLEAAPPDRLQVESIAISEQGMGTRVELRLSRTATYHLFTLTGPHRVVLDIATAALGRSALPLPAAAGAIREVRVAHRPNGTLRIVFDVADAMLPSATLAPDGGVPQLAVELRPATWLAAAPAVESPQPAVAVPALGESRRNIVVVVDAGHGGHDPGAHGPSGTREKDITLAVSHRLVDLLNDAPGMRGVLTRSDDRFLGLRERMERARSVSADLFISIHADAAFNRSAQGSTLYVLSEKAASDEASRRLAARENAALIGGVDLGGRDPVLASVLMDLSQNASISSSIAVGDAILGQMGGLGRLHRRSVQQAPFMVLKSPDVPSVLLETAYISNPADEKNLRSPDHQQMLALAVFEGIRSYFTTNPPGKPISRAPITVAAAAVPPRAMTAATAVRRHVVRRGDTLSGVASRYRVSLSSLRAANSLRSDLVRVGQRLRIPSRQG